jgi:hypothetical protein
MPSVMIHTTQAGVEGAPWCGRPICSHKNARKRLRLTEAVFTFNCRPPSATRSRRSGLRRSRSPRPRRKPTDRCLSCASDRVLRNPITGIAGCCGCAASGHAAAPPTAGWRPVRPLPDRPLPRRRSESSRLPPLPPTCGAFRDGRTARVLGSSSTTYPPRRNRFMSKLFEFDSASIRKISGAQSPVFLVQLGMAP